MAPERLLRRFDGRSRLLFRALLPGLSGSGDALRLFLRQRRCDPDFSLRSCLEALVQDELCEDEEPGPLKLSPVMCQLPVLLQRGLLSFLHLTAHLHPRSCLLALLKRLDGAPCRDPWVRALLAQLHRDLEPDTPPVLELVSSQCKSRLQGLCARFGGADGLMAAFDLGVSTELRWGSQSELAVHSRPQAQEVHRKRKSNAASLEQDQEGEGSQSKKRRLEPPKDDGDGEQQPSDPRNVGLGTSPLTLESLHSEQLSDLQAVVPEHIKAAIPKIRELLDMQTEWDQDSSSILQVLNECDPAQVELLCQALQLSELPEQLLPQLCVAVLALSLELSHSAATALIRSLFLGRVLSLLDPPSRCLVSAMVSLCGRYPRPACTALLGPVVQAGRLNAVQAELLCRLTRDTLEPQHQLLVLGEALTASWSEELLSVIHALLESRLELTKELFSKLVSATCQQASQFSSCVKFAKMVLTVLTKYQSHVSAAHKQSLSCCLSSHNSFLKKSLLAALKRIDPS